MTAPTDLADVFHAIADPSRRTLLDLLRDGARPVQDLARHFDMSLAAVSQHLRVLREAGLVTREARGRYRFYRADPRALREVHDWTATYRAFWETHLDALEDYLDESGGDGS